MKKYLLVFWLVIIPVVCLASTLTGRIGGAPFKPGERLTYQLGWEFIPVGTAILEVLPMTTLAGEQVHHFQVTVASNAVIDKIYIVRDRLDAYASTDMIHSVLFEKKQLEGTRKRDVQVTFDWENLTVQYSNFGKAREPVNITPGTFDPVSLFYAFRLQNLQENTELEAPVTDGKSLVIGKARIRSKETVQVGDRTYETLVVEPDIKDAGGVFEHSENARLRVWVTADASHIPVKVTCRAPVGHFIAELVSIEQR